MRLIFVFLLITYFSRAQYWVKIPDFPGSKRDDGVAVIVNNKAYFGTGLQEGGTTADFYALDLNNRSWKKITDMPAGTQRQYASAFEGTNCFYVFGGDNNGPLADLYKYDIVNDSWTKMTSKPGTGLIGPTCFVFGSKIIVTGGKTPSTGIINNEVWEYTTVTNTWAQKNNFPFLPTWHANAAVLNGFGYMTLGQQANDSCGKEFYKYDANIDVWTKLGDIPISTGRSFAALQCISNRLVLFGGVNCYGTHYNDMWYYNSTSNAWSQDISLPSFPRRGGMHCSDGSHLYYSCGYTPDKGRLNETWMTDIPLRLKDELTEFELQIYPNPFNDVLNIKADVNHQTMLRVENTLGEIVLALQIDEKTENEIPVSFLERGIYFVRLKNEKGEVTKKIIKI